MKLEDMTLAEIEQLEEASRMSISQLEDRNAPKGRLMRAIAFVAKRRDDPEYTWDQAGALTMADLDAIVDMGGDEPDDPTEAQPRIGSAVS